MKKECELQPGDMEIALSLKGNLGECAEFILEDVHTGRPLSDVKIKLIYYASFYELYFKYRLTTIHPSLIWKDPTKYKHEKHVNMIKERALKHFIAHTYQNDTFYATHAKNGEKI